MEELNSKFPAIRSLTRKELKLLRKEGLDLARVSNATSLKGMEMMDFILENFFPEVEFDDLPADECMRFASQVYQATYGRREDEKN